MSVVKRLFRGAKPPTTAPAAPHREDAPDDVPADPTPSDDFDETAYLAAHPDVRAAVAAGRLLSGRTHYAACGRSEGRSLGSVASEPRTTRPPYPPGDLIFLVTHGRDPVQFEATGAGDLQLVRRAVTEAGIVLPERGLRVLDWGCGCGRLARHWAPFASDVALFGCDINATLVDWCRTNLTFGTFSVSSTRPPLAYDDGSFDLLYGISVFTHLTFEEHYLWMREIHRVLAPGGVAVLTAHGPTMLPIILAGAKAMPDDGSGIVRTTLVDEEAFACLEYESGSNSSGNALNRAVFGKIFAPFDVRLHRPRFGLMGIHDTYVVTKKAHRSLAHVENLARLELGGERAEHTVALPLAGQGTFTVLADVDGLYWPATVKLTLRATEGGAVLAESAAVTLPDKVGWTQVDKAYATISIEGIPPHHGPATLSIEVRTAEPIDGAVLSLTKASLF